MVLVLDNQGQLSVAYPFGSIWAAEVSAAEQDLPSAIALDKHLGPERVFVLFSTHLFGLESVQVALQRAWAQTPFVKAIGHLPGEWDQYSIWYHKEPA